MTAADRWLRAIQKEAEKTLSCSNPDCACFDEHLAVTTVAESSEVGQFPDYGNASGGSSTAAASSISGHLPE